MVPLADCDGCDALALRLVREGVAPVVAAGWAARRADGLWVLSAGGAKDAYFDLASLTKPMTSLAVARESLQKKTLGALLPAARGTPSEGSTLELLLAHRAGLEPNLPLFAPLAEGRPIDVIEALEQAARARRPDCRGAMAVEGFAPLYSDLGYVLVGRALAEHLKARDAGEAIERSIVAPLGLAEALGTARALEALGQRTRFMDRVVATEVVPWRGGEVRGRVHDENAFALTGAGGSGHAGMFGTIGAVLTFGVAALDAIERGRGALGTDDDLDWMVRPRQGGTLRAGFDGKTEGGASMAGTRCGARTFGHLGFTGTSLWIDPDAEAVAVLLTNRVHPTRENIAIRAARPLAHDALFALALGA